MVLITQKTQHAPKSKQHSKQKAMHIEQHTYRKQNYWLQDRDTMEGTNR